MLLQSIEEILNMTMRKIIQIDEKKCDGCGQCVTSCAEGALKIIGGKARLVSETYCDGLGACLGHCPQGAISILEREAVPFDEKAVHLHLIKSKAQSENLDLSAIVLKGLDLQRTGNEPVSPRADFSIGKRACPGSAAQFFKTAPRDIVAGPAKIEGSQEPQLRNWPIQLHLTPIQAGCFQNAHLLLAADCVPFATPDFHSKLLAGKTLLIACPKLDDTGIYRNKLVQIFKANPIQSITVAIMEVPCCNSLAMLVRDVLAHIGSAIPMNVVRIGIHGQILSET